MSNVIEDTFKEVGRWGEDLVDGVEDVIESDAFKVVAIGAAVYFGGAGLMSMSNGGTFMAGASNATATWSSAFGVGEVMAAPELATTTEMAGVLESSAAANVAGNVANATEMAAALESGSAVQTGMQVGNATGAMTSADAIWGAAKLNAGMQAGSSIIKAHAADQAEKDAEEKLNKRQYFGMDKNGQGGAAYKRIVPNPGAGVAVPRQTQYQTIDSIIK